MAKKKIKEVKLPETHLDNWVFFPSVVYKIVNPEFIESTKIVADEYLEKIEKNKTGKPTIYQSENFYNDPRVEEFSRYIANTAWNILASQGYKMVGKFTTYKEMWAHRIEQYASMPQHVHGSGNQISGFYFLECPENSSRIVIHDPRPGKVQISLEEEDVTKATSASNSCNFIPEPGMVIFFNSWLPHSISENDSKDPVKLIHFNLSVIENNILSSPTPAPIIV